MRKVTFVTGQKRRIDKDKAYIAIVGIWMFLVSALRNYTIGKDAHTYLNRYIEVTVSEWSDIPRLAKAWMFEEGYVVLTKLLSCISKSPRFYLAATSFIIVVSFSFYIYKNSKIYWFSLLIFFALRMYGESMCLIRQYIAVSIILFAYNEIKENRLIRFIIIVLLASTIHTSALVVLPMFWISKIKFEKIYILMPLVFGVVGLCLLTPLSSVISNWLVAFLARHTTYARYFAGYSGRAGGAVGLVLIYLAFLIIIIIKSKSVDIQSRNMYIAFALASVAVALATFIVGGAAERLLPYFSAMFIASVPEAVNNKSKLEIRVQYVFAICAVLMFYYIAIVCRADSLWLIPYELWNNTM